MAPKRMIDMVGKAISTPHPPSQAKKGVFSIFFFQMMNMLKKSEKDNESSTCSVLLAEIFFDLKAQLRSPRKIFED